MEILDWLIAGTSVSGLVVYCAGMTLLLGALAWANHLDDRQENTGDRRARLLCCGQAKRHSVSLKTERLGKDIRVRCDDA
jgi:hypothetical protein